MLNAQQQAVVAHGDSALLVIAGAGSGKTTVMAHRAAALVGRGLDPRRLLLLTFTRRAAGELKRRVAALLHDQGLELPWAGTFHSVAARLLRQYGDRIGIDPAFSILDESDSRDLLGLAAEPEAERELREGPPEPDGGPEGKNGFPPKGVLSRLYSYQRNTELPLAAVIERIAPPHARRLEALKRVFAAYEERKQASHALDFDDLLHAWRALLRSPHAAELELFDAVMVDEYQDTNTLQSGILEGLCRRRRHLTVVGDDAQAIYAFRGATVENILDFPAQFAPVTVLPLETNYRSSQEILDAANALWAEAERGYRKRLTAARGPLGERPHLAVVESDWQQAETIAMAIEAARRRHGVPLREQAVLFRSSHQAFRLEMALQKAHLPYKKYGGQRFTDTAHVKDALAFLRCGENPHDEAAWRRAFGLLPGIGPASAGRLFAAVAAPPPEQLAETLAGQRFPAKAQPFRDGLLDTFRTLAAPGTDAAAGLAAVLKFYLPLLHDKYDQANEREAALRELQVLATRYATPREFLDDLLVHEDADEAAPGREDLLTLSTIHSAKGCEWRQVHVLNLVEGGLPSGPSQEDGGQIEEERRLLYVAMTRAKDRLVLYQPRIRETPQAGGGIKRSPYKPSRFLSPAVLAHFTGGAGDGACAADPVYEPDPDGGGWEIRAAAPVETGSRGGGRPPKRRREWRWDD
ncbi:MAG: ATP-dependent helicase [Lentisphaeria bacterium]